ncbi:MAG: hypothetical protein ACR2H7_12085 [Actinomycetota bacterium]
MNVQTPTTEAGVSPSPSPSVVQAPGASGLETAGAIFAIVFALAAAVLGYRIMRGGRGI